MKMRKLRRKNKRKMGPRQEQKRLKLRKKGVKSKKKIHLSKVI